MILLLILCSTRATQRPVLLQVIVFGQLVEVQATVGHRPLAQ
jgi:hypothetical protein